MNNDRRVVITGLGVVTPVGNDIETFWSNLKNGVSGIRAIDAFDTAGYDCKIGGQVRDFDPKPFFKNPKDVRRTDRFTQLAMAAAKMAVTDSGIDMENLEQRDRFGVIVSTGIGGLKTLQDQLTILLTKGPSRNSPFTIPMLISNMASGFISMEFNLRGPNLCIVTACATSNNAIGESWRIIKSVPRRRFGGTHRRNRSRGIFSYEGAQHAER
jgi:3-oxoacyl-[acyl-carrier-protein] synthase II